ncbi:hypothetical protein FA13DRAFT_1426181 [Coprinellus micaceus]|uniref:Uncharacterized protein n=1 Tax=Coprinellus micaceus TaxID=71717 RepID=A0A4Y7TN61_COPMI|nr:hypothetical protein FA13DRAFT_1426181 [Coprinellus micaceus]
MLSCCHVFVCRNAVGISDLWADCAAFAWVGTTIFTSVWVLIRASTDTNLAPIGASMGSAQSSTVSGGTEVSMYHHDTTVTAICIRRPFTLPSALPRFRSEPMPC